MNYFFEIMLSHHINLNIKTMESELKLLGFSILFHFFTGAKYRHFTTASLYAWVRFGYNNDFFFCFSFCNL